MNANHDQRPGDARAQAGDEEETSPVMNPAWQPGPAPPAGPRIRPWTVAAWLTIVVVCLLVIIAPSFVPEPTAESPGGGVMTVQGKLLTGAARMTSADERFLEEAEMLNMGPIGQRQRYIVLAAELGDVVAAADALESLDRRLDRWDGELTETQAAVQEILRTLYRLPSAREENRPNVEGLTMEQKELLRERLGWFGELALVHEGLGNEEARDRLLRSTEILAGVATAVMVTALVGILVGASGLLTLVVLALLGRLRSGLTLRRPEHGVYAETFAVWIVLFIALQIAAGVLELVSVEAALFGALGAFLLSLAALGWPVLRGLSWSAVREDIGLSFGRTPLLEIGLGLGGYLMALPMLLVGLVITLALITLQQQFAGGGEADLDGGGMPSHPIIEVATSGGWPVRLVILLIGAVAAPIVEETMFRGVLYRHLRDVSRRWGLVASIVLSVTVSAFIFAAIHPQGWVAIPALMSLAIAFALMREWRGTVVPAMIMHGVSNGIVLSMLMLALAA